LTPVVFAPEPEVVAAGRTNIDPTDPFVADVIRPSAPTVILALV
jgi:hypothetical protein